MIRLLPGGFCCQSEQQCQHRRIDAPFRIHVEREHRRTPPPQGQSGGLTLVNRIQVGQPLDLHHVHRRPHLIAVPFPALRPGTV
ncbi:hypothetical protein [Kitasatospora paranensis]|uniref:hypothetical protein n=1 Tax=Kitasatospora paranensis TaxID=258053 RepID=UPI0031E74141